MKKLATAVNGEDPAGVAAAIAPEEVRTLSDLVGTVEQRAKRAGLAGQKSTFSGVDVRLENMQYQVEELSPDVAKVVIRDGRLKVSTRRQALGPKTQELAKGSNTFDREITTDDFRDEDSGLFIDQDPYLFAVKRGGGWYVSLAYTAADLFTNNQDLSQGSFDNLDTATKAAATPEDAVKDLADAAGNLDVENAAAALSQPEWSVAVAYRRALEDLIERAQGDGNLVDAKFRVKDANLRAEPYTSGAQKVTIQRANGTFSWSDADDGPQERSWKYDGTCLRITGEEDASRTCIRGSSYFGHQFGLDSIYVVVVTERGGWAVSPMSTLLSYAKDIVPKITDDFAFAYLDRPDLAKEAPALQGGRPARVTLNSVGFANMPIHISRPGTFVIATSRLDDVDLYDEDGDIVSTDGYSSGGAVFSLAAGTYRAVAWRDDYDGGRTGEVTLARGAVQDMPASGRNGGTIQGQLSPAAPLVDYRFRTSDSVTRTLTVNAGSVSVSVVNESGDTICYEDEDSCSLDASTSYRLRVIADSDSERATSFIVEFAEEKSTVDGQESVTTYVEAYESTSHHISVGSDQTVSITISSVDGDIDCFPSDRGSLNDVGDETVTVTGPYEDDWRCDLLGGAGSYTISVG